MKDYETPEQTFARMRRNFGFEPSDAFKRCVKDIHNALTIAEVQQALRVYDIRREREESEVAKISNAAENTI